MDLKRKVYKTELQGVPFTIEVSDLAGKANGAVIASYGATTVLATAVMASQERAGDFFPLTVDYEERFYAAGKIIGSRFIRREGRASDEAILSGRLIDRTIRPLFNNRLRREVQVTITILSYDGKNDPDTPALLGVSTALGISDIPWNGPVGGFRKIKNSESELLYDTFFAGPEDRINMIEFGGRELPEAELLKIFDESQAEIKKLIAFQKDIIREVGKPKIELKFAEPEPRLQKKVKDFIGRDLEKAIKEKTLSDLKNLLINHLKETAEPAEALQDADLIFESEIDCYLKEQVLKHEARSDGRALKEIRPLYAEIGLFERTHGSGLFIRGETQVLAVTTLAPPSAEQLIETMETTGRKRFMLHYNFPGFSSGEVGRSRGPGRREIGHGALAAKAIATILPSKEEFPYTIRVVAETLSSNGSTSMASACATSLSLMDAGVPIKRHVAGISIGLVFDEESGKFKLLTDIQGPEDHHGGMDFKVAGTDRGVTALQMDVKIKGITREIFEAALAQAKEARLEILKILEKTISAPKPKLSPYAPTILTLDINPSKIGEVIGPGGKTINGIIASVGGEITIDIDQSGKVFVSGVNRKAVEKALATVEQIVREYAPGEVIEGKVIKILDFGAIVDLGGGQDGMIHVSELKNDYVKRVEDVVHLGDSVKAKVLRVENGKIGLSLKNVQ